MLNRFSLSISILVLFVGCTREPRIEDYKSQIQKDPLFVDYITFKMTNNLNSTLDFPIAVGAEHKIKQAKANGTLVSYYKSLKDVNGVSWYDAVIIPQYKRLDKFSKVYYKYVKQMNLPVEFIKDAEHQYIKEHRAI